MKKLAFFIVIVGMIVSGCKTQQKATTQNYDDVYYSKPKLAQTGNAETGMSADLSAPKYVTPPDSSVSLKSGSASTKADISDYSYSARLKHFHDPAGNLGYYDNYYTSQNSDSTSGNTTVNVYGGSGWDPSFSMGFGMGMGYGGWGYGGWGFGWDYPYSWYYPYNYWGPGCYCCGYYGYSPYWDWGYGYGYGYGNHYYGRRTALSQNNGNGRTGIRSVETASSSAQPRSNNGTPPGGNSRSAANPPYARTSTGTRTTGNGNTNGTPSPRGTINPTPQPVVTRTPADQQHYNYKRTNVQKNTNYTRANSKNNSPQRYAPRYVKPENSTPARNGQAQVYSSPAYRQAKSSQEYISPRNQQTQSSGNNNATRSYSSPSNNTRRYGSGNSTRTYSSPSNNSRSSYTVPARSFTPSNYSSPSRSSNYSAPSRSSGGGSYSAPSRSGGGGNSGGGNSGSGNSGGGGGGGHRK